MQHNDLGDCLRSWRDRLPPAAVGLPAQGHRRAPGLRREELAQLAGVSADYLTRLEQGRAAHPSPDVLDSLARALQVSTDERDHLFRLAGQVPPGADRMSRHLTPSVQRILDRLTDTPVLVADAGWTIVAWNPLGAALVGDLSAVSGRARNVIWGRFTGAPTRVVRTPEEAERADREMVADLHSALGRYPDDPELRSLVTDLRAASPEFAELWDSRPAAVHVSDRKTFDHPQVGRITLDCDALVVSGTDLRLIVYSAAPGSPDAAALELLGVVGLQELAG